VVISKIRAEFLTEGLNAGQIDSIFLGFSTVSDMVTYAEENRDTFRFGVGFPSGKCARLTMCACHFSPTPTGAFTEHVEYTFYMTSSDTVDTSSQTPKYSPEGPYTERRYYWHGVVHFQDYVDRAIIAVRTNVTIPFPAHFNLYPVTNSTSDGYMQTIRTSVPLFMTLSWIYTVSLTVKSIVLEKELRLKEAMLMMGLRPAVYWLGIFAVDGVMILLSALLISVIVVVGNVAQYSDPVIIGLLFFLFGLSTLAFSILISVFFSRSRIAAACGGVAYFLTYMPYIIIATTITSLGYTEQALASLLSTTAFGIAADFLAAREADGSGLQWSNFASRVYTNNPYTMLDVFGFLILDIGLYFGAAWYLSLVMPGMYGIPLPWYFPFQKSFWLGKSSQTVPVGLDSPTLPRRDVSGAFEPDPKLEAGLDVRNLSKVRLIFALRPVACRCS
jgi:hypothetical protein